MSVTRPISADTLVILPRLTAISTARLLQELLSAAHAEPALPAAIVPDRDDLAQAQEALQIELARRLSGEGEETPVVRAADAVEDNAFGALFDWLKAFARLPATAHPEAAQAATVLSAVFAGGLAFLAVRPHDEWQEAEIRTRLLAEKGYATTIAHLGGQPFLDQIASAHKAYGEALGITVVKVPLEGPAVRGARDTAIDVIRAYVLRVAALVRKSAPETEALAQRLLAPLVTWRERPVKAAAAEAPKAPEKSSIAEPAKEPGKPAVADHGAGIGSATMD
jgi:hypothetical protein